MAPQKTTESTIQLQDSSFHSQAGVLMLAKLFCLLSIIFIALPLHAEDEEDGWQFISGPFLWGTGLEGDLTVRGITTDVDLGFDDLFDVTDFGFQTHFELRKKKFGFYAAPSYMKLSGSGEAPVADVDFDQDFWLVEGGAFYNLLNCGTERPFILDATAGVRYWNISTDLEFEARGPAGVSFETDGHFVATDPVVGLRMRQYLTRRISLNLRGDVGGFDISSKQSKFTWQGMALLGYDFERKLFGKKITIYGGFRGVGIDKSEGSGSDKKAVDVTFQGALAGVEIKW